MILPNLSGGATTVPFNNNESWGKQKSTVQNKPEQEQKNFNTSFKIWESETEFLSIDRLDSYFRCCCPVPYNDTESWGKQNSIVRANKNT